MSAKSPKSVIHMYKMHCNSKIRKIESFISSHENRQLTAVGLAELKGLNKALNEQFGRMEIGWETIRWNIEDEGVLEELEKVVATTDNAVHEALVASRQFIEGKSIQISETVASPAGATASLVTRVKLLAFWAAECELWFLNVESVGGVADVADN